MSQLPLSIRVARGVLKYNHDPLTRTNRSHRILFHQDGTLSKKMPLHGHASTRAIARTAARASFGDAFGRNTLTSNGVLHDKYNMHRRPPFGWTIQNMISTSTPILDSGTSNNFHGDDTFAVLPEKEQGDVSIPFRRSKKAKSEVEISGFDDRARAKLAALSKAKKEAEDAKSSFLSSATAEVADNAVELHEKWNTSEKKLALAYSQAIKYTSRITKNEEATKTAERLLFEWMGRFLETFGVSSSWIDDDDDPASDSKSIYLNKKRMIRAIHKVVPKLTPRESLLESNSASSMPTPKGEIGSPLALLKIRIPPPASKDYNNLLRAYSMSKARRKGQQCEVLMRNMMQLAKTVAFYYDENDEEWTHDRACDVGMETLVTREGNKTEMWKFWAKESIPNSKVFALAIKCHAGTTHDEALERVLLLNHIHDAFAECCQSHIPGMHKDEPYVLFHSIKALKNLQKKEELDKGHQWLRKLHNFVTNPENVDYVQKKEGEGSDLEWTHNQPKVLDGTEASSSPEVLSVYSQTIDVTSAYTTFIRLLARLRGTTGAAADALKVLNRMHRVRDVFENGWWKPGQKTSPTDETSKSDDPEVSVNKKRIAYIDIRSNAYNLVIGLYKDSKKPDDVPKAIELLQRMVDAGNQAPEDRKGVPLPTEQSFQFTILSLVNMSDGKEAIEEAERLIQMMQDQNHLEPSVSVYNAYITVCNRQLFGKSQLYDKALTILDEMNDLSKTNPGVSPNPETLALVMKACSLSEHDDHEKVLATASQLFSQLEEQESSEKSALALTDRAYYCMMKCVNAHTTDDPEGKKDRIEGLFSEACQRGLCSAKVLETFRNAVSAEEYRLTVGEGRLVDRWVANVRGPRALYTDGSWGGAGKNARRKGKSTSEWAKKKRAKESQREARTKEKKAKKFFKKKIKAVA